MFTEKQRDILKVVETILKAAHDKGGWSEQPATEDWPACRVKTFVKMMSLIIVDQRGPRYSAVLTQDFQDDDKARMMAFEYTWNGLEATVLKLNPKLPFDETYWHAWATDLPNMLEKAVAEQGLDVNDLDPDGAAATTRDLYTLLDGNHNLRRLFGLRPRVNG